MSRAKASMAGLPVTSVMALVLLVAACADENSGYSDADKQKPQNTQRVARDQQPVEKTEVGDYEPERGARDEVLPATAHRTITFVDDSVQLSEAAKKSLERMARSLNSDLSTHMIVRTVDPNDVSVDGVSPLANKRAEALKAFLESHGVNIIDVHIDEYSSRELVHFQDSQDAREGAQSEATRSEIQDSASEYERRAEQEVVITVVSTTTFEGGS